MLNYDYKRFINLQKFYTMSDSTLTFLKGAAVLFLAFIAIIASVGVFNAVSLAAIPKFYGWIAGLNLIAEGFGLYKLSRKFFPKQ